MSDEVEVPYGDNPNETATLLLAAAEELELDPSVVRVVPEDGVFYVPKEIAKQVKDDEKPPAKKAAAKKSASK